MRRAVVGLLWVCGGCAMGPNTETLIDDLRVVGVTLDPPEAAPGQTVDVDVTVSDPQEHGAEVLFWTCTDPFFSGECLEASLPLDQWVSEGLVEEGHWGHTLEVPGLLGAWFKKGLTEVPLTTWTLACEPGLCDLFDEVRRGEEGVSDRLASPDDIVSGLPFEGVSLARRQGWVSGRAPEDQNRNPTVEPLFDEGALVERARGVELRFSVSEDEVDAYGFAERGGFSTTETREVEGEVLLTWFPPEEGLKGDARTFVAFEDGEGGSAVWEGTIQAKEGQDGS